MNNMDKKKILIVDDALFIRQFVRNILIGYGFEVIGEASNGEEAISMYFELKPDLVICDIIMPKMNGMDFLKNIIAKEPNAKIVMLSALDAQETVINALHFGAKDYLVKPIKKRNLIRAINRIFAFEKYQNDNQKLLGIFMQIISDLNNYLESSLLSEIDAQITYILRSTELNYSNDCYFDEKRNRIFLKKKSKIGFTSLNKILIELIETIKIKVESYVPYAKNIFTESFRFVYLRNKSVVNSIPIKFPDWLEKEIKFVDEVMSYLF